MSEKSKLINDSVSSISNSQFVLYCTLKENNLQTKNNVIFTKLENYINNKTIMIIVVVIIIHLLFYPRGVSIEPNLNSDAVGNKSPSTIDSPKHRITVIKKLKN